MIKKVNMIFKCILEKIKNHIIFILYMKLKKEKQINEKHKQNYKNLLDEYLDTTTYKNKQIQELRKTRNDLLDKNLTMSKNIKQLKHAIKSLAGGKKIERL